MGTARRDHRTRPSRLLLVVGDELEETELGADPRILTDEVNPSGKLPFTVPKDPSQLGKILDHLGPSTREAEKPPPPAKEVLRVAVEKAVHTVLVGPSSRPSEARFEIVD